MQTANIRTDEWAGLGAALLLHAGLLAVLLMKPDVSAVDQPEVPQSITVSLADDVGLQASTPVPVAESRASMGSVLSDVPAPSINEPIPVSRPQMTPPQALAPTTPQQQPVQQPVKPSPSRRDATPRARTANTATNTAKGSSAKKQASSSASTTSTPKSSTPKSTSSTSGGASKQFSEAFDGAGTSTTSADTRTPTSGISGAAKSSLLQSVVRQLKPHWKPPEGADADKLYTMVSFRLNENGSLSGTPTCKATQGVNPSNQAQANIHCREAIRAIKAAAPFNLPDRFYNAWKTVNDFKFGATL